MVGSLPAYMSEVEVGTYSKDVSICTVGVLVSLGVYPDSDLAVAVLGKVVGYTLEAVGFYGCLVKGFHESLRQFSSHFEEIWVSWDTSDDSLIIFHGNFLGGINGRLSRFKHLLELHCIL